MTQASPWVSIFSRFTSEALLFEALIIFTLCALYTGFWLLRKRKYGVVQREVPAGVVKYYLNELIVDAELLRSQLFGLLAGQGVGPTPLAGVNFGTQQALGAAPAGNTVQIVAGDPQSAQTLAALEAKLAEQAKQIENFISERARVEQELAAAKAGGAAATPGAGADDSKLKEKIAQLEAKLAEYSVIEDDLANLKRLQQENAALKTQLGGKPAAAATASTGAAATATAATEKKAKEESQAKGTEEGADTGEAAVAAAKAAAEKEAAAKATAAEKETAAGAAKSAAEATQAAAGKAAEKTAAEAQGGKVDKAATEAETQSKAAKEAASTTAQAKSGSAAAEAGKETKASGATAANPAPGAPNLGKSITEAEAGALDANGFEGLVDQVEQSIQPAAAATEAIAPATSTDAKPSTEASPAATIEKSDADLVAEFEKMLNG